MKPREPRVYRYPKCASWTGVFYAFDVTEGRWKRVQKSTGCTNKSKALAVVQEFDRLAKEAAGGGDSSISREHVLAAVNHILRMSGLQPVVETQGWKTYSDNWLAMNKPSIAPATYSAYGAAVRGFSKWLGERAEKIGMSKVNADMVQAYYEALLTEGKAIKTAGNMVKVLSMIFERARNEGFCARNPVALLKKTQGEQTVRERDYFSQADTTAIIKWLTVRKNDPEMMDWLTMCYLGLCTGRRLSDCANIAWTHIEGTDGPLVWVLRPKKMKRTGKVERVPLVDPLETHLLKLRKKADGLMVCPTLAGLAVSGCNGLSARFGKILKAAGVKVSNIVAAGPGGHDFKTKGFHSWRHTLPTLLAATGTEERLSKRIVGHESSKVHTGYTHVEMSQMRDAIKKALAG